MCSLERFKIDLKGLTDEATALEFDLDDTFFKALDAPDVQGGTLHVSVSIRKATGFFEFLFHTEGTVTIPCDICLDDMQQPIATDNRLVVKLGSEQAEQDDVIIVAETDPVLDTSWLIYEFIALAIPIKHVHQPGDCNVAMLKVLQEHSAAATRSSDEEATAGMDPRWSRLADLVNKES